MNAAAPTMKTFLPKVDEIQQQWWIVDAEDLILGRMAVKIADTLRGKNKPVYTPHLDCGDFVVVVNAEKVQLTGRKESNKIYQDYTGYMDGQKSYTAAQIRAKNPLRLVRTAVWGMMPKGRLGRAQFRKLKIYAGSEHPHQAQQPQTMTV